MQLTSQPPRRAGGLRPQRVGSPPALKFHPHSIIARWQAATPSTEPLRPGTGRAPSTVAGNAAADRPTNSGAGFTLLELLIVITIIGLLAAVTVPSLKNAQKSNALAASSQQLIDDIAFARRVAIKDRTTVLMIFLPTVNAADAATYAPLNTGEKNVLLRGQQTSYALYTARQVGDQPGDPHPRYARSWRTLPNGYFIPTWKFDGSGAATRILATNSHENAILDIAPFKWTPRNDIPVPSLHTPRRVYVSLPYIAFGPGGGLQVQSPGGDFVPAPNDEFLPLARGAILHARDPADDKKLNWEPADIAERPDRNSVNDFHLIVIDKLTGRTRVAKPEIRP